MSLARDVTTVGSATLLSRLLGFFRDMGIASVLGAGVLSDAFFAVLQLVNVFRRMLAEGALNAAFVPLWLRIKAADGEQGTDRFFRAVLEAMILACGALALIGLLFAPAVIGALAPGFGGERGALAADYLHIAAPYVVLAGAVAVLAAALNAQGRVGAAALGIVAFNAVLLLALTWIAAFGPALPATTGALLAHAIVLAGIVQLAVTGAGFLRLRRRMASSGESLSRSGTGSGSHKTRPLKERLRLRFGFSADARRFFARAVPGLVAAGVPQLKLIAGAMVASASPAAVSWLYYANRLYELPLGVVSIASAAVLVPAIALSVRDGAPEAIAAAQSRGYEIGLGLALPSAVGFALLAQPIAGGLFERGAFGAHDTAAVAAALAAICAGLPGHVLEKVLGAVSFAHEDTRTPMLAALAGLATAVAGALVLFPHYGHVGVAAAIAISGWVGAALLGAILARRGWLRCDRGAARRLPRIVAATLIMGMVIFAAHDLLASLPGASGSLARLALLVVLVALGLAVYLASLELLGVARLRDLIAAVRARL
ncbi:MAG: lipid II flippase MurJ [Xanthobacteraceae bacterium]|jgi:putative peptidoglycan lipid II flippase